MSRRLIVSKNLLADNGVIFISIDDNEQAQLKLLCDKLFGANNYIAQFIWKKSKEEVTIQVMLLRNTSMCCVMQNVC